MEDPYQNHNVTPSLGSDVYNYNLPSSSQAQGNVEETKNEAIDVKLGGGAKEKKKLDEDPIAYQPKVPFSSALKSKSNRKQSSWEEEMMELFKQDHINLPLLNAINHVPAYARFLKELCTQKRKPRKVVLSKDVSAILLNHLPQK